MAASVPGPLELQNWGIVIMLDRPSVGPQDRVSAVVHRMLSDRSITRTVGADDDLRQAGLSSLDMVNLVLTIEAEFDVRIPEVDITPANFRSIALISKLVVSLLGSGK
jgi:acyl carrier protein